MLCFDLACSLDYWLRNSLFGYWHYRRDLYYRLGS